MGPSPTGELDRRTWLILVSGCTISLITIGVRSSLGLFTDPLSATRGWGRETFAFAVAVQNLAWGLAQPLAGAIFDRFGPARMLAIGGILYAAGIVAMAYADTPLMLTLTVGVMVGVALGGASNNIVLASFARLMPDSHRSWAFGLSTASGSLGQFILAPLGQLSILAYGWQGAAILLGGIVALTPLLATSMSAPRSAPPASLQVTPDFSTTRAVNRAFRHRSYVLLVMGFFTCGFQVAFITVHLPPYLADMGVGHLAGWTIGIIGLFNVMGAYLSGVLGGKLPKRYILATIYIGRAIAITTFLLLPVSPLTVIPFAAVIGFLWLSTVPPTSGLVVVMFGTRYVATLYGLVFLSHQLGGFAGAWLGGILFETTGSYDAVWWLCVGLAAVAALLHLPIAERPADTAAAAAR